MVMEHDKDFKIPFIGLKLGKHNFEYQIGKEFFESYGFDDFDDITSKIAVVLEKKQTMLEVSFHQDTVLTVPCDVTNEIFDLPCTSDFKLIVKFGDQYNDDNEELLILPFAEFQVDLAQYIYEMVVLSIPVRRIHPDAQTDEDLEEELDDLFGFGGLDDLITDYDDDSEEEETEDQDEEVNTNENIDPRWDKLKQLLTDK